MATALEALLGATKDITREVYMGRLKAKFKIRPLSTPDLKKAGEQATIGDTLDNQLHNAAIISIGCIDPVFSDKALRDHYEATDAADCVTKALLPGEVARLVKEILALSGFTEEDEAVDEIKN